VLQLLKTSSQPSRAGFFLLLALLLALGAPLAAVDELGGSLSAEPAYFVPMGAMGQAYHAALGYGLDFDIPFSDLVSSEFGLDYTEMPSRHGPDSFLQVIPARLGLKLKRQWQPEMEYYGAVLGECIYQRSYLAGGGEAQELTTGGFGLEAGYDWWISRSILVGLMTRGSAITQNQRIHPFVQLGLRLGWRQ
jgi:hypothetical protein